MSRRSQVVRTEGAASEPAQPRSDDCGCSVRCYTGGSSSVSADEGDGYVLVGPIALSVTEDFRRIFISASVAGISVSVPE